MQRVEFDATIVQRGDQKRFGIFDRAEAVLGEEKFVVFAMEEGLGLMEVTMEMTMMLSIVMKEVS